MITAHLKNAKKFIDELNYSPGIPGSYETTQALNELWAALNWLATYPVSFANTTGPATKQSESSTGTPVALTESQEAILTPLVEAITACIKSHSSTLPVWDMTWDGSSILLRISPSPTTSGSNEAGNLGPAAPDGWCQLHKVNYKPRDRAMHMQHYPSHKHDWLVSDA